HARITSALHKMAHLRTQSHLCALRGIALHVEPGTKCSWCYKPLSDAVFVAHPFHALRDPLSRRYVVDFQHGGDVSSHHSLVELTQGIRHGIPSFVFVCCKLGPACECVFFFAALTMHALMRASGRCTTSAAQRLPQTAAPTPSLATRPI